MASAACEWTTTSQVRAAEPASKRERLRDDAARPLTSPRASRPRAESDLGDFSKLNQMVSDMQQKGFDAPGGGGGDLAALMQGLGGAGGGDLGALMQGLEGADLGALMEQGAKMFEGMLEMPEVKQIMEDPALLRQALADNPMLDAVPGMREMFENLLESDEMRDPQKFKETMAAGVAQFKSLGAESLQQMGELLSDPAKLQQTMGAMLGQLAPEQRKGLEALMSGDMSALANMAAGAMSDPAQIEQARQQMLQNLDNPMMQQLMAASGADMRDAVNDPEQWRQLMQQQMEALTGGGGVEAGGFSGGLEL